MISCKMSPLVAVATSAAPGNSFKTMPAQGRLCLPMLRTVSAV